MESLLNPKYNDRKVGERERTFLIRLKDNNKDANCERRLCMEKRK